MDLNKQFSDDEKKRIGAEAKAWLDQKVNDLRVRKPRDDKPEKTIGNRLKQAIGAASGFDLTPIFEGTHSNHRYYVFLTRFLEKKNDKEAKANDVSSIPTTSLVDSAAEAEAVPKAAPVPAALPVASPSIDAKPVEQPAATNIGQPVVIETPPSNLSVDGSSELKPPQETPVEGEQRQEPEVRSGSIAKPEREIGIKRIAGTQRIVPKPKAALKPKSALEQDSLDAGEVRRILITSEELREKIGNIVSDVPDGHDYKLFDAADAAITSIVYALSGMYLRKFNDIDSRGDDLPSFQIPKTSFLTTARKATGILKEGSAQTPDSEAFKPLHSEICEFYNSLPELFQPESSQKGSENGKPVNTPAPPAGTRSGRGF